MIKISVIIPIYNMEQYLSECLDSVLCQTLEEIEILCIDDGSTDGTKDILRDYASKNNKVIVITQNRLGEGGARNAGLAAASGEYIAFMDSDDYYPAPDVLEYLYVNAKKNNVLMARGAIYRDINGVISLKQNFPIYDEDEMVIQFCEHGVDSYFTAFIYARELICSNNITFPKYKRGADQVFQFTAESIAKRIWVSNKCVYVYREFDKVIDRTKDALDELNALLDIMKIANKNGLMNIQNYALINKVCGTSKNSIIARLILEKSAVKALLDEFRSCIIDDAGRAYFDNNYSDEAIRDYVQLHRKYVSKLKEKLSKREYLIIYGAGAFGKQFYDFAEGLSSIKILGFASTYEELTGTARGFKVVPISQYASYKNSATVVICAKDEIYRQEMNQKAEELGFDNIAEVSMRMVDFDALTLHPTV